MFRSEEWKELRTAKNWLSLLALIGLLVMFGGCALSGGDQDPIIGRVDISSVDKVGIGTRGDRPLTASAVSPSELTALYELDDHGLTYAIDHFDLSGNEMPQLYPLEVRNIDETWLAVFYSVGPPVFPLAWGPYADLMVIVDKNTGDAYPVLEGGRALPSRFGYGRVINGNLYLNVETNGEWNDGRLYRITPSSNPTVQQVSLDGEYVAHSIDVDTSFNVADDGTVIYNYYQNSGYGTRVVSPDGATADIARANNHCVFWRGLDGSLYYSDDFVMADEPGLAIKRVSFSGSEWAPIDYHDYPDVLEGTQIRLSYLIETDQSVVALIRDNLFYQVDLFEVYRTDLSAVHELNWVHLGDRFGHHVDWCAIGGIVCFLESGRLVEFDVASFAVTEPRLVSDETIELYEIERWSDTDVLFSGLRLTDGALVSGRLNVASDVVVITDEESGIKIQQLERIR